MTESQATPDTSGATRSFLDSTARVVTLGRHAVPIVRAWAGLIRAEADLARDGLAGLLIATGVVVLGVLLLLSALTGGAILGLRELGWPLWAAIALPAATGLLLAAGAGWLAYARLMRLTFPETRCRFIALLEVLDEP